MHKAVVALAVLLTGTTFAQSSRLTQKIVFVRTDSRVDLNVPSTNAINEVGGMRFDERIGRNERLNTLAVMDADGSHIKDLKLQGNEPALSPDGTKIAFSRIVENFYPQIFVANVDGTGLKQLTNFADRPAGDPAWSPDGKKIVFEVFRTPQPRSNPDLYLMNADGSEQVKIMDRGSSARFSPDGVHIVFASRRDGNFELYSAKVDGSELRRLTNQRGEDSQPAWSPDGSTISFVSDRDSDRPAIYLMNADGSDVQRLAFSKRQAFCFPAWTPDGKSVLFTTVNVIGTQLVVVGEERPKCEQWAGEYQIYSIGIDGSHVKMITGTKEHGFHASTSR